jgi:D-alanyl-D-alanine carboxypeptidase (penicillin-binding protein 5/6)
MVALFRTQPGLRRVAAALACAGVVALVASLQTAAQTPPPKKDDGFQISAPYAILIDADSGTVLFEKNSDKLNPPASMSKLMTTEVVLHAIAQGKLKWEDEMTISENAWRKGGAPSGGSAMFAALNSRLSVRDLLHGVMIQSGNDACIALAEGIAGSELAFAEMMNRRAREIGLTQSRFTNSTGLHESDHNMTVRELAKLAQHIIKTYPEAYKIYAEREFTWNRVRQQNRNPLLAMGIGADGLKTGFTKEAGYGLTGSAVNNGLRLIVVGNGFKTMKERSDEMRKLLEWGFRAFESRALFAAGETIGEAKLYGAEKSRVSLISPTPVRLLVPRAMSERLSAKVVYSGHVVRTLCSKCRCRRARMSAPAACTSARSTRRARWSSTCSARASTDSRSDALEAMLGRPVFHPASRPNKETNAREVHHIRGRRGGRQVDPGGTAGPQAALDGARRGGEPRARRLGRRGGDPPCAAVGCRQAARSATADPISRSSSTSRPRPGLRALRIGAATLRSTASNPRRSTSTRSCAKPISSSPSASRTAAS